MRTVAKVDWNTIENNLNKWFDLYEPTNESLNWYENANALLKVMATNNSLSHYNLLWITAILSPKNPWTKNPKDAVNLALTYQTHGHCDNLKVSTYSQNKNKAVKFLSIEDVEQREGLVTFQKSPKVYSFVRNLMLDDTFTTIDGWMIRAALTLPQEENPRDLVNLSLSPKNYRILSDLIIKIGKDRGFKGYQVQAVIWENIRKNYSNRGLVRFDKKRK